MLVQFSWAQDIEESFDQGGIPEGWTYTSGSNEHQWRFGYQGVMPHSGPTIESEFNDGAVLFNNAFHSGAFVREISLQTPVFDVSALNRAHLQITYNFQVTEQQAEFQIDIYDGSDWKTVYTQNESSPKNTGLNEMLALEVSELLNDEFQVRFVFRNRGMEDSQALGIDHFALVESLETPPSEALGLINLLNIPENVLVLDAQEEMRQMDSLEAAEHLMDYEISTHSLLFDPSRMGSNSLKFQFKEQSNVGSYKRLLRAND